MDTASGHLNERTGPSQDVVEDALAVQRALMDADRAMLQIISTALSMIGIGVTIYAFFTDVAHSGQADDLLARRLGISLLVLGLVVLVTGMVSQGRYRLELVGEHRKLRRLVGSPRASYRTQPTLVIAGLLLLVGVVALANIVSQQF
jgi:uncharacterized membrane protein YidH (DUF202 family)